MSWDGYIDSVLGGSKGACDSACVIGLTGGASWTTPAHAHHMHHHPPEGQAIAAAMTAEDYTSFQAKGIFFNGEKYQFLRHDPEEGVVLGKKKDKGAITIHKTNTAIIIAHTAEGKGHGDTNDGVSKIVKYLKELNM